MPTTTTMYVMLITLALTPLALSNTTKGSGEKTGFSLSIRPHLERLKPIEPTHRQEKEDEEVFLSGNPLQSNNDVEHEIDDILKKVVGGPSLDGAEENDLNIGANNNGLKFLNDVFTNNRRSSWNPKDRTMHLFKNRYQQSKGNDEGPSQVRRSRDYQSQQRYRLLSRIRNVQKRSAEPLEDLLNLLASSLKNEPQDNESQKDEDCADVENGPCRSSARLGSSSFM